MTEFSRFLDSPEAKELRERVPNSKAFLPPNCPKVLQAELRPYQKDGFDFLAHLVHQTRRHSRRRHGSRQNIADVDLARVAQGTQQKNPKPSLVICPASVLHNWRREAERFTPNMKVLVLESGAARHNLRKQIPQNDIIVTNYALLAARFGRVAEICVPRGDS
jgi:SNF2 family DNA or RNA helicase